MNFINRAADSMSNYERNLDVIGDNLANLGTMGYRARRTSFHDSADGVVKTSVEMLPTAGVLQATHVPSDLAIQGDGYFVVQDGTSNAYTRDGSLHMDPSGKLLFSDRNLSVLGYGTDASGNIDVASGLVPLRIPIGQPGPGKGSTTVTWSGNLNAAAAPYTPPTGGQPETGGVARVHTTLYDSLGAAHGVDLTLTKSALNTWQWNAALATGDTSTLASASGQLTFGTDGLPTVTSAQMKLNPSGGATQAQALSLDFSGLTQQAGNQTAAVQTDAFTAGTLTSFTVGGDGTITGQYSAGGTAVLGRVAMARFANPAGLSRGDNNLSYASGASGTAQVGGPGQNGLGTLEQGSLEGSNVDLTVEFARMIMSQRAYQANSRLMRTGDEMWQELMDLKR